MKLLSDLSVNGTTVTVDVSSMRVMSIPPMNPVAPIPNQMYALV